MALGENLWMACRRLPNRIHSLGMTCGGYVAWLWKTLRNRRYFSYGYYYWNMRLCGTAAISGHMHTYIRSLSHNRNPENIAGIVFGELYEMTG